LRYAVQIAKSLPGRKEDAGNTGAAFVNAVVFAAAKITLNIALFRHGQMHPSVTVPGLAAKTGVIGYVYVHFPFLLMVLLNVRIPA
jgi:hypothetical protein